jgi:hypothetical protein
MNTSLNTKTAIVAIALMLAGHAYAEDVKENRAIDNKVSKVALDAEVDLSVSYGPTASMTVSGDKDKVSRIQTSVSGDTLHIGSAPHVGFITFGHSDRTHIDLVLPELKDVVSGGVGNTEIKGFSGDRLHLVLAGAGNIRVGGNYKQMDARLSGVGNMEVDTGNSEDLDFKLSGTGHVKLKGQSKTLTASLSGLGNLDAKNMQAEVINVSLSGFGNVTAYAKQSANVRLSGLGSADIYGQPSDRNVSSSGLGKVSWR